MVKFILKIVESLTSFNSDSVSINQSLFTTRRTTPSFLQDIPSATDPISFSEETVNDSNQDSALNNINEDPRGSLTPFDSHILSSDSSTEIIDLFVLSQNKVLNEVFKLLNYSLISGEYIANKDIQIEIATVKKKLSETLNFTNDFDERLQTIILELNSAIGIGIEIYRMFIKDVENKYSNNRIDLLFSFNKQIERNVINSNLSTDFNKHLDYFATNLELSRYDHFPSSEDMSAEILFKIENAIDNIEIFGFEKITKILKLKISFLKYKWKARKKQENRALIYYSMDGEIKMITESIHNNEKIEDWSKIIVSHYELENNWKSENQNRVKIFKHCKLEDLNFLQIHQLIKYYKDVNKNYSNLHEISEFLLKKTDGDLHFDNYCNHIFSNYALNNRFSSYLEKHDNIDEIKKEYYQIRDRKRGDINNFFLEFKYLNAIIDILLKEIENGSNLDFIKKYEKLVKDEHQKILDEYFENKEWSKRNYNYIFQLPFEESLISIPKTDDLETMFIASSFILPPVNNIIEKQYYEIRQKFKGILLHIDVTKRLRKDLEKIEDLNKAFDKRDFKSIEIISIFTAIITFVLSSIPSYKFIDGVWDSLLFMLTLASSLGIFVMLILFSTRGFRNNSRGVIFAIFLFVIAVVGYNCLVGFEKTKEVQFDSEKSTRDSIKVLKFKLDSISKAHLIKNELGNKINSKTKNS